MMLRRRTPLLIGSAIGLMLSGCVTPPEPLPPSPPAPVAKSVYRVGPPYQIGGVYYYPKADLEDAETGIASVYGPDVAETLTANGEAFDQNAVAGAHRTLALPTIVQVTNLENGRFVRLRLNDRGPHVADRIIQVTRHAAELLGIPAGGSAKVRIHVVVPETIEAQSLAKQNGGDVTVDEPPPPAVPHGTVLAQALPALGSPAQGSDVSTAMPVVATGTGAAAPNSSALGAPAGVHAVTTVPLAAGPASVGAPPPSKPAQPSLPSRPDPETSSPIVPAVADMPVRQAGAAPSKTREIFVQAGAFVNDGNAMRLKTKLDGLGRVEIAGLRINGTNIYRVRIGPIPTVEEANRMLTRATAAGASDAKIVFD